MTTASDKRLSPEQVDAKQIELEKKKRQLAQLKKDFSETFAPAHGKRVLRWIMDQCGYTRSSTSVDPTTTKILTENMLYNESRRNLYLSMRQYLSRDTKIAVENEGMEEDESVDNLFS